MIRFRRYSIALVVVSFFLCTCSKVIGWGVLLWYTEDPPMPSGTVLPVYVRSNIEELWVVGIPAKYRTEGKEMLEVSLPLLELAKNKRAAEKRVEEFGEYVQTYAETVQDGLPIRDAPENNSRRVYRLKLGEILKVLGKAEGIAAISSTGSPLPGDWLYVLTKNGVAGYCFSYKLKLFEHEAGVLAQEPREIDTVGDRELDLMLSRPWYPESYGVMAASGKVNLGDFSKRWGFDSGTESGTAHVFFQGGDLTFPYRRIVKESGAWVFEGSSLKISFRSESSILVRWEEAGKDREEVFVTFSENLDNIIRRETERREALFQAIYGNGPSFHSVNYGTINFRSEQRFTWNGAAQLPAGMLSEAALGSGAVDMGRFLEGEPDGAYSGVLALVFDTVSGEHDELTFLYSLESQGMRLEYVPPANLHGFTVTRRDPQAPVIYFSSEPVSTGTNDQLDP
jgi:hypothetical protein